jgi:hypothetical protein
MKKNGWRAVIEVGFIIFLFYSDLLMGEFERSGMRREKCTLGPSSCNSTGPFFATLLFTALLGRGESDAKATSNCRHIRIQVRSPLFGVCRFQLGIASKTLPLQAQAISIYRHSCQALDGEAFRPNHGLA